MHKSTKRSYWLDSKISSQPEFRNLSTSTKKPLGFIQIETGSLVLFFLWISTSIVRPCKHELFQEKKSKKFIFLLAINQLESMFRSKTWHLGTLGFLWSPLLVVSLMPTPPFVKFLYHLPSPFIKKLPYKPQSQRKYNFFIFYSKSSIWI